MDKLNESASEDKVLLLQEQTEIQEVINRTQWTFYEDLKNFTWNTSSPVTNDQP